METMKMSFMASYIDVPEFGRILLGWAFVPVLFLIAIKWTVQLLKNTHIVDARIWAAMQFHSCFVLPDVEPLGRKGNFFCSWAVRIVTDLVGSAAWIIASSLLVEAFVASGQISWRFLGLAVFYFLLGCGLMVQGRKKQKLIRGDNHSAPLDIGG
ncbi:hypothetical protein [Agrobacterium sp. NPDC090283]|uniref:hypothetical protein n=1 Tax=Agrobacterium sp. NPDC090283 TaxID=3363920 RepID=UPI00383BB567